MYHIAVDEYTPLGYTRQHMKQIVNRLNRLEGQLTKVKSDIASGEPCEKVIPQLLATKGALSSCIEEYLVLSLRECASKKSPDEVTLLLETIIRKM